MKTKKNEWKSGVGRVAWPVPELLPRWVIILSYGDVNVRLYASREREDADPWEFAWLASSAAAAASFEESPRALAAGEKTPRRFICSTACGKRSSPQKIDTRNQIYFTWNVLTPSPLIRAFLIVMTPTRLIGPQDSRYSTKIYVITICRLRIGEVDDPSQ